MALGAILIKLSLVINFNNFYTEKMAISGQREILSAKGRHTRWSKTCTATGGRCIKNFQCCDDDDFCMLEKSTAAFGFGLCKRRSNILDAYLPNSKFGYKKTNQECSDSIECVDQCCRPTRMARFGTKLKCGKPDGNTACVGQVFSMNDIYNGY